MNIVFTKPFWDKRERIIVERALGTRKGGGEGPFCKMVEKRIKRLTGAKHVFLTPSCSQALELAMMSIGIGRGDEVICPSFTFVSIANAIVQQGAKPVFVEIREETLNMDPDDVRRKLTQKTRAIVPVHYAGISCEMDEIIKIAKDKAILVIEDAAQAVYAKYKGKWLGTIGDIGCYSFHETKNLSCGEGGAFVTNDRDIARRTEIIREKGTDRSAFLRGEVNKYTWRSKGSSYILSDILAAILYAQFNKVEEIHQKRKEIFTHYFNAFDSLEREGLIKLPEIPSYCRPNYHIFYFLMGNESTRNKLLSFLKKNNIEATFHYVPLHSSPFGRKILGYKHEDLPITENVANRLIRLPIYPELTRKEQDYIIRTALKYYNR